MTNLKKYPITKCYKKASVFNIFEGGDINMDISGHLIDKVCMHKILKKILMNNEYYNYNKQNKVKKLKTIN